MKLALILLLALPAAASELDVVDVTPAFWAYWDKAKDLPRPEQVRLFRTMVADRHPELYNQKVIGYPPSMTLDQVVNEFFDWAPPHLPKARAISAQLRRGLPKYIAQFQKTFPDFRADMPVYFMVSMRGFDGAVRTVNGKPALLLGVEMIAAIHSQEATKPFFEHELFHRYHNQVAPDAGDPDPIWWAMWKEGLATYVAHRLNPNVEFSAILGRPTDLEERAKPLLPQLARELLQHFDATDDAVYRQYFFGQHGRTDIPPRTAYYVGYLVAKEMGEKKELRDLARLSGPELREQVRAVLKRMANPPHK
jgi:hypothetical protein